MIAFDLQCANGHVFEGWFEDGVSFEMQKKKGLLTCPICDDVSVNKIPSTFGIMMESFPRSSRHQKNEIANNQTVLADASREMVEFVENNFDDVGCDFTKEALKIHYGVTKPRNIKGVSTKKEEKMLKEEGVQFFRLPVPAIKQDFDA